MAKVTKTYIKGWMGNRQRKKEEKKLFENGYRIILEEDLKQWEAGNACCLALLFLPLIFIKTKKVKVTYEKV